MTITRSDQNELVLPLFEDLLSEAPWDTFLSRLLPRSGADRVLLIRAGRVWRTAARGWGDPTGNELVALGDAPAALRPNRVYALDELRNFDNQEARQSEAELLAAARIVDARLIRIGSRHEPTWLVLLAERTAFSATASALLSGLAPAVEIAATQMDATATLHRRIEAAESSLALLGIGQAVLAENGEVLAADALWQSRQATVPRLPELDLAGGTRAVTRMADGTSLLFRKMSGKHETIATFRMPRREQPHSAAEILAAALGLSAREASLAALLSQGLSLIEAGRSLKLTDDTTRNYSKRIYATTGARGQGDLVRIVMSGIALLG